VSTFWSLWVIIGTVGTLAATLWLLLATRNKGAADQSVGHDFDGIVEMDNPLPLWWVGMFIATIVFAAAYVLYYPGLGNFAGFGAWTSIDEWTEAVDAHDSRFAPLYEKFADYDEAALHADPQATQIGRRLYINHCSTCHGLTAQGSFGFPNLSDGEWIWGGDFEAIQTSILDGRLGVMPPWGAALDEQQIGDVVHHVLSLAGRDSDAPAAARGAEHYQLFCVACHAGDGRGNAALGAPDLTNDVWLYGATFDEIAFTVRQGRNGEMPAHRQILGEARAHLLAGFVSSLGKAAPGADESH
jgi:cytochrome c oxidase cbb3-type subunit 3